MVLVWQSLPWGRPKADAFCFALNHTMLHCLLLEDTYLRFIMLDRSIHWFCHDVESARHYSRYITNVFTQKAVTTAFCLLISIAWINSTISCKKKWLDLLHLHCLYDFIWLRHKIINDPISIIWFHQHIISNDISSQTSQPKMSHPGFPENSLHLFSKGCAVLDCCGSAWVGRRIPALVKSN